MTSSVASKDDEKGGVATKVAAKFGRAVARGFLRERATLDVVDTLVTEKELEELKRRGTRRVDRRADE
jgi:hypothetical protein